MPMRVLLKAQFDVEAGNRANRDGDWPDRMRAMMARLQPEAAYFLPQNGKRTALIVFDLKDPSEIPVVAEPFFRTLNATVEITPVMTADDLQKGLQAVAQQA